MTDYAPARSKAGPNQTDYAVPFPYIAPGDVKAKVNGLAAPIAIWLNSTTVRLSFTPPPGAEVIVYRETPQEPYVTFTDSASINASNLNSACHQALFNGGEAKYAYRAYIEAEDLGVRGDHNGLPSGGTENWAAFQSFIGAIAAGQPQRGHFRGGVRLQPALWPDISIPISFSLIGDSPRASYLYLETEFDDYFLVLSGTTGLWGATNDTFTAGIPKPPPQSLNTLTLKDFAVFGRGTNQAGDSFARQRGIGLRDRISRVTMEHVHFYNIDGTALAMGLPTLTSGRGGIRESVFRSVHITRCGSLTEPAWLIASFDAFGPNFLYLFDCECSLSRGKGLVIRNRSTGNTIHNTSITGLKLHGTGLSGTGPQDIPPPITQEALTIEGPCDDYNSIRDLTIVQSAQGAGKYALNFIAAPLRTAVRAATTANGALSTAFANGQTVDVVVMLVTGDRILIKDQTNKWENGIYTVNASGAPTRAADLDASAEFGEPPPAVKVTEGNMNHDTCWTYAGKSNPTLGTTDLPFVKFDWGYPSNFTVTGAIEKCQNGLLIEGGHNISVELADNSGIDVNVFSIGAGVDGPISLKFNLRSGVVGICEAQSSPFVILRDSQLSPSPALWIRYRGKSRESSVKNTSTSLINTDLAFAIAAGETWQFVFKVFYYTKAAADFKYTLAGPAAATSISLTKNLRAPGATIYATTPAAAFPSNEAVTSSVDGYGEVELRGTIVNGVNADTISFKFAQNTADSSDTLVLAGSLYEAKKLA